MKTDQKYWEITKPMANASNQELLNEYLLHLKLQNHSEGTIIVYRLFLESFYGDRKEEISSITSDVIQEWFLAQQEKVKENTVRFRLSVLASFYTFCIEEEYMEQSPMKSRWNPKIPEAVPKYLDKEEIAKIRHESEKTSLRDQLLIEFLLVTGCRIGEIVDLQYNAINMMERTVHITGKGGKIRQIHFTDKCGVLLERYLKTHPKQSKGLFVNKDGRQISKRRMQQIIEEIGKKAGISGKLHPHRLRHTFATDLLAKGADLGFIQDELGHSNIETTKIYARIPQREIVLQYRKYMG